MDIQFRRRKYGTKYYKIPVFLVEKDKENIKIAIDYFDAFHGHSFETYDISELSQLLGNRKVAKGISSLMFKKYYKISNQDTEIISPSDFRITVYREMWKDGISWLSKDKQKSYINKFNQQGSIINQSIDTETSDGVSADNMTTYLFSDHIKFEKIYRLSNIPSVMGVLSNYNQEIMRSLFSKSIHFTLHLEKSSITSNLIKILFRNAKLWGIFCEAYDDETHFMFKLTGTKGLVGRSINSIFPHTYDKATLTLEVELYNKIQNIWIPINELILKNNLQNNFKNTLKATSFPHDTIIQDESEHQVDNTGEITSSFDSMVEEDFDVQFRKYCPQWKIFREPVLSYENQFFLPDFELKFHNQTVYLEIVGFWTESYLNKKIQKLKLLFKKRFDNIIILVDEKLDFQVDGIPTFRYSKKMIIQKLQKYLYINYEIPELDHYIKNIDSNRDDLIDAFRLALKEEGILDNKHIAKILGTTSLSNTKYVCENLLPELIRPLNTVLLTNQMKLIDCEYIIQFQQELMEFVKAERMEEDTILERFSHIKFEEIQELLLFLGYYQDFESLMDVYFIPPTHQREIIPQIV